MQSQLFSFANDNQLKHESIADGATILRHFAVPYEQEILADLRRVMAESPFRYMMTPMGYNMSVSMTNCGMKGWITDRSGYRYTEIDPFMQKPWPSMPLSFLRLAQQAALEAGYDDFMPEGCLINQYFPDSKLSLHQDNDEKKLNAPIVSVSLGIPAIFLFGGLKRDDPPKRVPLFHGDVVVWGGASRLCYHGIAPIKWAEHPLLGVCRINLTFRTIG